ncbi:hypothetical protein MTsPCn5_39030 [Croceitalea sp. MTPC5]|uniref:YHS domain-containing (seleno)protein n=1 Tax=Croceitalea sp. MTPC5 TaxID=3056565 RepID=UPI002B3B1271|nr:hypothetical protein MTsPCn5_39030 [Croceitalea sp. MTPC5]
MKHILTLLLMTIVTLNGFSQKIDYSLDKGYIAEGYDVTEYFNGKAVEGKSSFTTTHDGAKFKFTSQSNLDKFKANPKKYVPQYGGYCAYALATRKKKVDPDPEAFKIQDGQLLLFYTSWTTNTKDKWEEEGPKKLKPKADTNWEKVKYKK